MIDFSNLLKDEALNAHINSLAAGPVIDANAFLSDTSTQPINNRSHEISVDIEKLLVRLKQNTLFQPAHMEWFKWGLQQLHEKKLLTHYLIVAMVLRLIWGWHEAALLRQKQREKPEQNSLNTSNDPTSNRLHDEAKVKQPAASTPPNSLKTYIDSLITILTYFRRSASSVDRFNQQLFEFDELLKVTNLTADIPPVITEFAARHTYFDHEKKVNVTHPTVAWLTEIATAWKIFNTIKYTESITLHTIQHNKLGYRTVLKKLAAAGKNANLVLENLRILTNLLSGRMNSRYFKIPYLNTPNQIEAFHSFYIAQCCRTLTFNQEVQNYLRQIKESIIVRREILHRNPLANYDIEELLQNNFKLNPKIQLPFAYHWETFVTAILHNPTQNIPHYYKKICGEKCDEKYNQLKEFSTSIYRMLRVKIDTTDADALALFTQQREWLLELTELTQDIYLTEPPESAPFFNNAFWMAVTKMEKPTTAYPYGRNVLYTLARFALPSDIDIYKYYQPFVAGLRYLLVYPEKNLFAIHTAILLAKCEEKIRCTTAKIYHIDEAIYDLAASNGLTRKKIRILQEIIAYGLHHWSTICAKQSIEWLARYAIEHAALHDGENPFAILAQHTVTLTPYKTDSIQLFAKYHKRVCKSEIIGQNPLATETNNYFSLDLLKPQFTPSRNLAATTADNESEIKKKFHARIWLRLTAADKEIVDKLLSNIFLICKQHKSDEIQGSAEMQVLNLDRLHYVIHMARDHNEQSCVLKGLAEIKDELTDETLTQIREALQDLHNYQTNPDLKANLSTDFLIAMLITARASAKALIRGIYTPISGFIMHHDLAENTACDLIRLGAKEAGAPHFIMLYSRLIEFLYGKVSNKNPLFTDSYKIILQILLETKSCECIAQQCGIRITPGRLSLFGSPQKHELYRLQCLYIELKKQITSLKEDQRAINQARLEILQELLNMLLKQYFSADCKVSDALKSCLTGYKRIHGINPLVLLNTDRDGNVAGKTKTIAIIECYIKGDQEDIPEWFVFALAITHLEVEEKDKDECTNQKYPLKQTTLTALIKYAHENKTEIIEAGAQGRANWIKRWSEDYECNPFSLLDTRTLDKIRDYLGDAYNEVPPLKTELDKRSNLTQAIQTISTATGNIAANLTETITAGINAGITTFQNILPNNLFTQAESDSHKHTLEEISNVIHPL